MWTTPLYAGRTWVPSQKDAEALLESWEPRRASSSTPDASWRTLSHSAPAVSVADRQGQRLAAYRVV